MALTRTDQSNGQGFGMSGGNVTITYNSTPSSGDLIIIWNSYIDFSGSGTITPPTGFTEQYSYEAETNNWMYCWAKVSDGTETSAVIAHTSSWKDIAHAVSISSDAGDLALTDIELGDAAAGGSGTSATVGSLDPSDDTSILLGHIARFDTSLGAWDDTPDNSFSVSYSGTQTGGNGDDNAISVCYRSFTTDPGSTSYDEGWSSTEGYGERMIGVIEPSSGLAITPAAETVNVTAGTLTIDMNMVPAAETVNVTAGTLTITQEQFITPGAATVTATAGTLDISQAQPITPAAETVTITAGTMTITTTVDVTPSAVTVNATPGTLTVAVEQFVTPDAETVTVTAGTLTISTSTPITPAAETVTITAGTLSLTIDIPLDGPTVTATPGTVVVTVAGGAQAITPEAVTVTATAGTLDVAEDKTVDPEAVTVTVTAGTFTILLETSYTGPTITTTAGTVTVTSDYPITPAATTVTATAGTVALTGGNVIIYAAEAGNFYRKPGGSPRLVLGIGPRRSMTFGLNSGEGWELVSEQFKLNGDDAGMQEAQLAVAGAWAANSGAATAVLKAAIDQALQDAGYRRLNGTSLV